MNILVLMDSFKGSLSSIEAGNTIKKSILKLNHNDKIEVIPVADGGEGTVDALLDLDGAKKIEVKVNNPLMEKRTAKYAYIAKDNLAIMEMSEAAGLMLIKDNLSPLKASTFGVGEMIKDALDKDIRNFIIGIGGSATNDGGIGMLSSLGFQFLDKNGEEVYPSVSGIADIKKIDISKRDKRLDNCTFNIACDVDNPLTGENGAAFVFASQKGANDKEIELIDNLLSRFHLLSKEILPNSDDTYPGVGAAGGLGYAFKNYLNANLKPGIQLVLDFLDIESKIKETDLIITGEGKIDYQTSMGKTPIGIAELAKKYNKKVIAFAGIVDNEASYINEKGIDAFFPILDKITSLEEAMSEQKTKENLSRCVTQVFRLINLWRD